MKYAETNITDIYIESISEKLKNLAKVLDENKLMFAQIEFLLRNTPVDETLNIDLCLIIQNLKYCSSLHSRKFFKENILAMHGQSPLSVLGFVAQMLLSHQCVTIACTKEVAVTCHLFVTLCHDVGLPNIKVAFLEELPSKSIDVEQLFKSSCVGVVAERGDVESAVDAFLTSATNEPWKVRRILVQESVVYRFINTIEWKTKLKPSDMDLEEIKSKSSNAFFVNGKLFLYEYCGEEYREDFVIIEAYRTNKELLSLLARYKPFSVSLWCSDVSESNEIAYGIDANFVWINEYGTFHGPNKSSQAYYAVIDNYYSRVYVSMSDVNKVTTILDTWTKLDVERRLEILNKALKRVENVDFNINIVDDSFVEVDSGKICVGIEVEENPVLYHRNFERNKVFNSLLKGTGVIYLVGSEEVDFYRAIESDEIPLKPFTDTGACEVVTLYSASKLRVIRTNFGTIYAN
ncbi:uncharacterized protein [Battus philenor]|uniref:uncharacterized protein n=1 Tax=Battus philenor TaxID=42288 RepID=UPI0035CF8EDD